MSRLLRSAQGNSMDLLHARFTTAYVTLNVDFEQEMSFSDSEALKYPLFFFLNLRIWRGPARVN